MKFIKRNWDAFEADEWTKEDWIVIVLSPLIYFMLIVGFLFSLLLMWQGFVILAISIFLTWFMHWIIDPKLKAISKEYEKKQKDYIKQLERSIRWEE